MTLTSQIHDVSGRYVVEVTFQSYRNPTGKCVNCPDTSNRGCCDENFIRQQDQTCSGSSTCDTGIGYCIRPLGATQTSCPPQQATIISRFFHLNTNTFDFSNGQNSNIIPANPVTIASNEPWRVSISSCKTITRAKIYLLFAGNSALYVGIRWSGN